MQNYSVIQILAMLSSVALPFFNIPLIIRIFKRRSSKDLSLIWAIGVWTCMVGMTPGALQSSDFIFTLFSLCNLFFFTGVLILVLWFRR